MAALGASESVHAACSGLRAHAPARLALAVPRASPCAAAAAQQRAARQPEQCGCERQQRRVAARGILDSYRAAQGGQTATPQASVSVSSSEEEHVVESLLLEDGIHFTEEDTPCLTDCVIQVYSEEEMDGIFRSALPDALVVVDWFKTDCPACKYMLPGFHRMCRSASEHAQHIIFVKHNVYNEDDELTPLARRFKIKSVPQFSFHKSNGELVESFATRDKARLTAAVDKWAPVSVENWEDEAV